MSAAGSNISKSVGRAFALLELFAARREALTAAALRAALDVPAPSLRALLTELRDLGYLDYDPASRCYQPTARVTALGDWLPATAAADPRWARLVAELAADTGETASLCLRRGLRLEIVHVAMAAHPVALQLRPGPGELLWRTAAGRTLLSAMPPGPADELLAQLRRRAATVRDRRELQQLPGLLADIRRQGHYVAYDIYLRGVGTVCLPLQAGGQAAVLAVAGASDRIRDRAGAILRRLRRHRAQLSPA